MSNEVLVSAFVRHNDMALPVHRVRRIHLVIRDKDSSEKHAVTLTNDGGSDWWEYFETEAEARARFDALFAEINKLVG